MKSVIAIAAVAVPLVYASALTTASVGGAKIVNYCSIDIPLEAVPAQSDASGVTNAEIETATLSAYVAGSTSNEWFTPWVSLEVDGGWSLKLDAIDSWTDIMQYEYTWAGGDDEVWYDMSFVNGDETKFPDWEFIDPSVQDQITDGAYTYSTDDAEGMQVPVAYSNTVTLVLCPASATATSAVAGTTVSSVATTATPAAEPTTTASSVVATPPAATTAAPTTFQTTTSAPAHATHTAIAVAVGANNEINEQAEVVTEFATLVVTAVVTETAVANRKRHEHRHPHGHSH